MIVRHRYPVENQLLQSFRSVNGQRAEQRDCVSLKSLKKVILNSLLHISSVILVILDRF